MKQAAINFFRSIYGQILLYVVAFAFFRWLWTFSFYDGFNGGFERLTGKFGLSVSDSLLNPFHSWSIFFGSFLNPVYALVLIFSLLPFLLQKKYFPDSNISFTRTERIFFTVISFVIGWELATYDYNFYLDRAFYPDRILLFVLPVLIYRFPQLLILFASFALAYRSQFNYPVDGFPMFDKRLLFDLLMCGVLYQYCRIFIRDFRVPLFYLLLCIVASTYFATGMKKVLISPHGYEWVMNNDPLNLFNNVYLRGWMACASETTIENLRSALENFGGIFQWCILLLELGALFLLRNRKFAAVLLLCFSLMHLGIFIFGSMLFWKWMVVDVTLAIILWRSNQEFNFVFSDRKMKWMSLVIIATSFFWLKPIAIGWHDTNVNQYFTYEVVGEDGKTYSFDKNQMNPYHQWFQFDHFLFLTPYPALSVSGFGYSNDYKSAMQLQDADYATISNVTAPVYFDEEMKSRYDQFIVTYFQTRNARIDQKFFLKSIAPPHHLYSQVCENPYADQTPVKTFRVIYNLAYTKDNQPHPIMQEVVDEIIVR